MRDSRTTWAWCLLVLFLAAGALAGCETEKAAYDAAVAEGTPEALRAFLDTHPDGMYAAKARPDLDEMEWLAAREEDSSEGYERYLEAHGPDAIHAQEAETAVAKTAWREMDLRNDRAGIEAFLERYGNSAYATQARERLALLDLAPRHVTVGGVELTESDTGGWIITAEVTNIGATDVTDLAFRVGFEDANGDIAGETESVMITSKPVQGDGESGDGNRPLEPGESRTFSYALAGRLAPEGWVPDADHVRLALSALSVSEG